MYRNYTNEQKKELINRYAAGENISDLSKTASISRNTIYKWISEVQKIVKPTPTSLSLRQLHDLKLTCNRQKDIIDILNATGCTQNSPLKNKYDVVEKYSETFSVNFLCEALNLSKGSYYNHILRNKNENTLCAKYRAELTPVIENIFYDNHEIYGPGKITAIMKERGYKVCESTVAKIMHSNN